MFNKLGTVLLIKHKVNVENQNYYHVVPSLMCTTYRVFIYDFMQWRCVTLWNVTEPLWKTSIMPSLNF